MSKHMFEAIKIALLNDALRERGDGGEIVMTPAFAAIPIDVRDELIRLIRRYDQFDEDKGSNDPYSERDFGMVSLRTYRAYFKIDYFDLEMECRCEDPADPSQTNRVMTLMLQDEY